MKKSLKERVDGSVLKWYAYVVRIDEMKVMKSACQSEMLRLHRRQV